MSGVPFGRYLLGDRLATGAMGEVHVAVQRGLGGFEKPLALKLLLPHLAADPAVVNLFLAEAQLAARMSHPNVVHVFDVGLEADRYFIAMELVHGVALSALIDALDAKGERLAPALVLRVARALGEGLRHTHEQKDASGKPLGIVHRDVTPQNVLVSVEGEVKLTDFGIARVKTSPDRTQPGVLKGKVGYAAPEQVLGQEPDLRADLFGAAVTLFHLATGVSPFLRERVLDTLEAVRTEPLPSLGVLRPDLPVELAQAIERAAAKRAADRFSSAQEFLAALPPLTNAEDPRALGALVQRLCGERVARLERHTEQITGLRRVTEDLPELSRPRARRWWLAAVAAGALAGGGALVWTSSQTAKEAPGPFTPSSEGAAAPMAASAPARAEAPPEPEPPQVVTSKPAPPPERTRRPAKATLSPSAPAPKPGVGYATLDADPWAEVWVGKERIGETPIARFPFEPGEVAVVFKNPDTGKSVVKRVRVSPGRHVFVRADVRGN